MLAPGNRLRDYEILAHLRSGGMANLFLGRRVGADGFSRLVAIKVVNANLARDPGFIRMFVDEARISARINHPNVVHVEELGDVEGFKFLVMEYVLGASLAQLLGQLVRQRRRLTPKLAVHIAVRVAEGLHAAHETRGDDGGLLQIVHRDISPQNVLVAANGHVKLIDFGIAKARGRSQQTTTTGLKGKIRYMAPEQAHGREVDRRCDVYALGVVLWEMLTATRLFGHENELALLDLVRNPKIDKPSTLNPNVSPELDAVVMAALAPNLEDRLPTAQEFRRRLAEAMPSALTLDASALAELVEAVLGEELGRERDRIAAVGNAHVPTTVFEKYPAADIRELNEYTTSDAGISEANAPGSWNEALLPVSPVETPAAPASRPRDPMSGFTPTPGYTPTPAISHSQPSQKRTGLWIAVVLAISALGLGSVSALAYFLLRAPEQAPTTTSPTTGPVRVSGPIVLERGQSIVIPRDPSLAPPSVDPSKPDPAAVGSDGKLTDPLAAAVNRSRAERGRQARTSRGTGNATSGGSSGSSQSGSNGTTSSGSRFGPPPASHGSQGTLLRGLR